LGLIQLDLGQIRFDLGHRRLYLEEEEDIFVYFTFKLTQLLHELQI